MLHDQFDRFFQGFRRDAHPMAVMTERRGAPCRPSYHDSLDTSDPQQRMISAHRLIAKIPTIAARAYKYFIGQSFVSPRNELGYAENFLRMCFSVTAEEWKPNPVLSKAMDKIFILHADHEQNASTSTVRMAGSTGVNPFACIAAGIAALWGPAHGGANEEALNMLKEIGTPDKVPEYVAGVKDRKYRLMGFGHRVYKNYDPRAKVMQATCHEVLKAVGDDNDPLLQVAMELERVALHDQFFISRKLYPNVDFYSGITPVGDGLPVGDVHRVLFALARTVGSGVAVEGNDRRPAAEDQTGPASSYIGPAKQRLLWPSTNARDSSSPARPGDPSRPSRPLDLRGGRCAFSPPSQSIHTPGRRTRLTCSLPTYLTLSKSCSGAYSRPLDRDIPQRRFGQRNRGRVGVDTNIQGIAARRTAGRKEQAAGHSGRGRRSVSLRRERGGAYLELHRPRPELGRRDVRRHPPGRRQLSITGVSGTANGQTITGLDSFDDPDNLVFPPAPPNVGNDRNGISFDAGGIQYNLYEDDGGYTPGTEFACGAVYCLISSTSATVALTDFSVSLAGGVPEPATWTMMLLGLRRSQPPCARAVGRSSSRPDNTDRPLSDPEAGGFCFCSPPSRSRGVKAGMRVICANLTGKSAWRRERSPARRRSASPFCIHPHPTLSP